MENGFREWQRDFLEKLKELLKDNESASIKDYLQRIESVLESRLIVDMDWDAILNYTRKCPKRKLDKWLAKVTRSVEEYK